MTWERTPELEEAILTRLENGESLVQICQGDYMPSRSTVLRWQREDEAFDARCAHAREAQGDLAAEEQNDIAERCLTGEIPPDIARVVLSAKQWRAEKLAHKKYGKRVHTEHSGAIEVATKEQRDAAVAAALRADG